MGSEEVTDQTRAALIDAKTVARARDEKKRRERWLLWAEKAFPEWVAVEQDEHMGIDVASRRNLLERSLDLACGTDRDNAAVTAARYLFDAEVIGDGDTGAAGPAGVADRGGVRLRRQAIPARAADETGDQASGPSDSDGRHLPDVRELDAAGSGGRVVWSVQGVGQRQEESGGGTGDDDDASDAVKRGSDAAANHFGVSGVQFVRGQGWQETDPDHRWCFRCLRSGDRGGWHTCPYCHPPAWTCRRCPGIGACIRSGKCDGAGRT